MPGRPTCVLDSEGHMTQDGVMTFVQGIGIETDDIRPVLTLACVPS